MKITLYIILVLLNVSTCSKIKDIKEIKFGEGGGFTAAVTSYQINPNGDVFIIKSIEKEQKKIKTITQSDLVSIQKKINNLSDESLKFNHPGNIYRFIEIEKDGKKLNIVWGDPSYNESKELKELYSALQKIINP